MINEQLLNFIRQSRQSGVSDEQIKQLLLNSGWQMQDILDAFNSFDAPFLNSTVISSNPNRKYLKIKIILVVAFLIGGYFALDQLNLIPGFDLVNKIVEIKKTIFNISTSNLDEPLKVSSGSVLIFADEEVYKALTNELIRFKDDIARDLKVNVYVRHSEYNNPIEIRKIIKNFYSNEKLLGSILIGNIPTFHREDGLYTDWFYQDLDDRCVLTQDGKFDKGILCNTLDAISSREVFSGRITPPVNGQEGIVLIKKYLDKNHEYRSGNISFQKKLLVYPSAIINEIKNKTPLAIQNSLESNLNFSLSRLEKYPRASVDLIEETDYENAKKEYLNKLKTNSYEAALINIHGASTGQSISGVYGQAEIDYKEIKSVAPNIFYVNLLSCSNGAFKELNYLAGWFLFSGKTMVVNAQSESVFIGGFFADPPVEPPFFIYLNSLGSNIPIGNMIKRDNSLLVTQTFGDPTLQLPNDRVQSKLLISSQQIDFGNVEKIAKQIITIRNDSDNSIKLRRLPNRGLTINSNPLDMGLTPAQDVNFFGFYIPNINPYQEITVLPNKEISIEILFAFAVLKKSQLKKEGNYFDIETFITNDPTNPYLDIKLMARVR